MMICRMLLVAGLTGAAGEVGVVELHDRQASPSFSDSPNEAYSSPFGLSQIRPQVGVGIALGGKK